MVISNISGASWLSEVANWLPLACASPHCKLLPVAGVFQHCWLSLVGVSPNLRTGRLVFGTTQQQSSYANVGTPQQQVSSLQI
tara:strand:- start:761 stop:1009 length:249 start_codon:yes stop_codon:yes gene_type:complete